MYRHLGSNYKKDLSIDSMNSLFISHISHRHCTLNKVQRINN